MAIGSRHGHSPGRVRERFGVRGQAERDPALAARGAVRGPSPSAVAAALPPVRCIARYGRWYCALYSVLVRGGLKFGWNGAEKRVFGRPRPKCHSLSAKVPQFAGQHA